MRTVAGLLIALACLGLAASAVQAQCACGTTYTTYYYYAGPSSYTTYYAGPSGYTGYASPYANGWTPCATSRAMPYTSYDSPSLSRGFSWNGQAYVEQN
jgi:hypothetical protein